MGKLIRVAAHTRNGHRIRAYVRTVLRAAKKNPQVAFTGAALAGLGGMHLSSALGKYREKRRMRYLNKSYGYMQQGRSYSGRRFGRDRTIALDRGNRKVKRNLRRLNKAQTKHEIYRLKHIDDD
jgi:hypothetical protein